jgi:flagellar assembly protein FliH
MSVRLIKAGETHTANPFSPPSLTRTNRPLQFAPTPSTPAPTAQAASPDPTTKVAGTEQAAPAQDLAADGKPYPDELVRQARAEAERLVAEAQTRAAEIERGARERGRAEALAQAQAQAQFELNRAVEDLRVRLAGTLEELAGLRSKLTARAEQDLVRLALEIAKKIVQREVKVDHEVALTLARVALGRLHNRAGAVVRLHPDDYAYIAAHRERLSGEASVEIVEDRSVGVGGCVIQSEMGEIDARIEQQFAEIEQDFLST